jgi:hypothetical protein
MTVTVFFHHQTAAFLATGRKGSACCRVSFSSKLIKPAVNKICQKVIKTVCSRVFSVTLAEFYQILGLEKDLIGNR